MNSNSRLTAYGEKYAEILDLNGIPFTLINPNSSTILDDIRKCTHLLFRHSQGDTDMLIYDAIFHIAHNILQIECYPNFETYWPYENKIKEYLLLKSQGFPIIDSEIFWTHDQASDFIGKTDFPIVAKLPKGAGSSNVVIIKSRKEGQVIINQVFKKGVKPHSIRSRSNLASLSKVGIYQFGRTRLRSILISLQVIKDQTEYPEWQLQKDSILLQKYLPDNTYDTRVTIIGNRAFAFRRFVRKNDFRASGSGNFNLDPDKIDTRCLEIAFAISRRLNFVTMAYDFIYDENKYPFINEISYCFVDEIVRSCPGYWDETLSWHEGQNWPQYFQLKDFLKIDNLKTI